MRRREFIVGISALAAAWPLASHAEQLTRPTIGFLGSASQTRWSRYLASFRLGLKETGYIEGKNVVVEYRWAEGRLDRLPDLASDFVRTRVAVIVAAGGAAPAFAAKAATSSIPIVFAHGSDPVKSGLVTSLARPGGNVTGVTFQAAALGGKRLELLKKLVPKATKVGVLVKPNSPQTDAMLRDIRNAARKLGLTLFVLEAQHETDFDMAFATFAQQKVEALLIGGDRLFVAGRRRLAELAKHYAIPAVHDDTNYPEVGGLMAYGPSIPHAYRQIGVYVGRILTGEKPADLPVLRSSEFDLVINLKTANMLGLKAPPTLLMLANRVVE